MSGGPFYVRRATEDDTEAILLLERSVEFAPHWRADTYARIVRESATSQEQEPGLIRRIFVAVEGDPGQPSDVVGFAVGAAPSGDVAAAGAAAELESLAVQASWRRRGVARLLCREVIDWTCAQGASYLDLEVRQQSNAAIVLYRSLGFRDAGRRPRYYHSPDDDAVVMRIDLRGSPV